MINDIAIGMRHDTQLRLVDSARFDILSFLVGPLNDEETKQNIHQVPSRSIIIPDSRLLPTFWSL